MARSENIDAYRRGEITREAFDTTRALINADREREERHEVAGETVAEELRAARSDGWLAGFATALAEMHAQLIAAGADPLGWSASRRAPVSLSPKRAGSA